MLIKCREIKIRCLVDVIRGRRGAKVFENRKITPTRAKSVNLLNARGGDDGGGGEGWAPNRGENKSELESFRRSAARAMLMNG